MLPPFVLSTVNSTTNSKQQTYIKYKKRSLCLLWSRQVPAHNVQQPANLFLVEPLLTLIHNQVHLHLAAGR